MKVNPKAETSVLVDDKVPVTRSYLAGHIVGFCFNLAAIATISGIAFSRFGNDISTWVLIGSLGVVGVNLLNEMAGLIYTKSRSIARSDLDETAGLITLAVHRELKNPNSRIV